MVARFSVEIGGQNEVIDRLVNPVTFANSKELLKEKVRSSMSAYQKHPTDCGSSGVQSKN